MDFSDVSKTDLTALIDALDVRLKPPYSSIALKRIVSSSQADAISAKLMQLHGAGFSNKQIALLLTVALEERKTRPKISDVIDLVTTGPEAPGIANRDTAVVVRNLFSRAQKSVLVAGYAVYQGQQVFEALARRMDEIPDLEVTMCLDLQRGDSIEDDSVLVRRFAEKFKAQHWPSGSRVPKIYFDPRGIDVERSQRASLHAKCVVVDRQHLFISSANFTRRAQFKNIEVGLQINSPSIAQQLTRHFLSLMESGLLKPAIW